MAIFSRRKKGSKEKPEPENAGFVEFELENTQTQAPEEKTEIEPKEEFTPQPEEKPDEIREFEIPKSKFNWKLLLKTVLITVTLLIIFSSLAGLAAGEYFTYKLLKKSINNNIEKLNDYGQENDGKIVELNNRIKALENKIGSVSEEQSKLKKQASIPNSSGTWLTYINAGYKYSINYLSTWIYLDKTSKAPSYVKSLVEFKISGGTESATVLQSNRTWAKTLEAYKITKKGNDYYSGNVKLARKEVFNEQGIVKSSSTDVDILLVEINKKVFEFRRGCNKTTFDQMISSFKLLD